MKQELNKCNPQLMSLLGDKDSEIQKTIRGVKVAKRIISKLVKLGAKLKDLI